MNLIENTQLMKTQTIGVEIEMGKISKQNVMHIVSNYFNEVYGIPVYEFCGGAHGAWNCNGKPNSHGNPRVWKFMDDGSSSGDWGRITCEMVTPILTYDDIPDLQEIVRRLRGAGARSGAHWNAGVHIHVGANFDEIGGQNAKSIRNLINLINSHERMLCKSIDITPSRASQWARFVDPRVLREINEMKPKTKRELQKIWYGDNAMSHEHYHHSRYHLLNLHAIWDKGTIEFRCFEFHNNLHAGELKAWIQLCLAMCSYSKLVRNCSPNIINAENQKYAMKNWLTNMGLIGDEFKTCRKMLLKNLTGDSGYRVARGDSDDDYNVPTSSSNFIENY